MRKIKLYLFPVVVAVGLISVFTVNAQHFDNTGKVFVNKSDDQLMVSPVKAEMWKSEWSTKISRGKKGGTSFLNINKENTEDFWNLANTTAEPSALYLRPTGTYFIGLDTALRSTPGFFAPAYMDLKYRNKSVNADSYSWTQMNSGGNIEYFNSTEFEPTVNYEPGLYETPTLKAIKDAASSEYFYASTNTGNAFVRAGNTSRMMNLDPNDGIAYYADGDNFYFGNCRIVEDDNVYEVDAVANLFVKPAQPAVYFGIDIFAAPVVAPGETEFTLHVINIKNRVLADTLKTVSILASDIKRNSFGLDILSFNFDVPIIVKDSIICELKGFNVPGVTFAAMNNRTSNQFGEANAYVFLNEYTQGVLKKRELWDSRSHVNNYVSLLFVPTIAFPVLHPDKPTIDCGVTSGTAELQVTSTFNADNLAFGLTSDWVRVTSALFDPQTFVTTFTIEYDALPTDVKGRSVDLILTEFGMENVIVPITQGNVTSIDGVSVAEPKVAYSGNAFSMTYDNTFKSVEVYNTSGQKLAGTSLPENGSYEIPGNGFSKGIYIFKFAGATETKVVKVIK